ncbi:hypothetical protein ACS0TY_022812 [Phlomoides rotata]
MPPYSLSHSAAFVPSLRSSDCLSDCSTSSSRCSTPRSCFIPHTSLLRVSVVGENTINGRRTKSHLRLVDLPGSERIGRNGVEVQFKKKAYAQWFLQVYFMLDMRTNIIMVLISLLSA